ncbi:CDP-glycerol glycerophosphotransferase family protein, partial [Clostridioides difficile]|nr:CDP-glycerol glycerophosphotransferase family protein [Clostridioides difficile]
DKEHLGLPVYQHMDYMIVQSEYAKGFCSGMYYYDKILPFGSPKLDQVIRLYKEGSVLPEHWKPLLNGKKILMLNTSIGCFLQDGSIYLQKIKSLCKTINIQNKVALIWRPHPLLEATIKSMRPHLLAEYNGLKEYFTENMIGILDETPDISRAVAISDGYIGEESSSVVNLFGALGKPIFILDNHIINAFTEEEKRIFHITDMV